MWIVRSSLMFCKTPNVPGILEIIEHYNGGKERKQNHLDFNKLPVDLIN